MNFTIRLSPSYPHPLKLDIDILFVADIVGGKWMPGSDSDSLTFPQKSIPTSFPHERPQP